MSFSKNIQTIRDESGLTQEQFAELFSVSRQTVSKWESGASYPETDMILKICDQFNVSMDTLVRGDYIPPKPNNVKVTTREQYDGHMNRFSRGIALPVGVIILSIGMFLFMEAMAVSERYSLAIMLILIGVAVTWLILTGIDHSVFVQRHPRVEEFYDEDEKEAFSRRFAKMIAFPVGAIVAGVVMLVFFSSSSEKAMTLAVALFMLIVSVAVTVIVYGSIQYYKYDIKSYNKESSGEKTTAAQRIAGKASGVIMLTATAIFLFLGFFFDLWNIAWAVFPLGGILCGIIGTIFGSDKNQ